MEQPGAGAVAGSVTPLPASAAAIVKRITALERVKNAAAAEQARLAVELRRLREAEARATRHRLRRVPSSVAAEIGLARRESPHRGAQLLGLAWVLHAELPCTLRLFEAGEISEYTASLVARETACLSQADRAVVDAALAGRLAHLSNSQLTAEARRIGYELDPAGVVERTARAERDRRVTLRPAPDCMAQLTALLPVVQGVAVFAALTRAAATERASGGSRTKGQVMADTLVERLTGQTSAEAVPVEVQLVITDQALFGLSDTAARVPGHGPVPAAIGRRLAASASNAGQGWLRRLYARPGTGELVAMESRARRFPKGMRQFLAVRDAVCRTPWCGAPIRHADHVRPVRDGGTTSIANGQGLCERCNQVKESPGWYARRGPDQVIGLRTPTGHRFVSRPPPLPYEAGSGDDSILERRVRLAPVDLSWRGA
ncbi:HNH endonuclease [Micropruina sonneratiae]|uniref:HNH endonuclease n=1 Tax=Micropruina sonneratiae TaxID=2986940 RepID=UPI002227B634|nr:DUF222 domain-containing protein [Micropruina sp. KQZ13P-5]MCW3157081.1 DUF222 domain-containing protein [Micropruina sp. KQZ13P-5]